MPLGAGEIILASFAVKGWDDYIKKLTQATAITERMALAEEKLAAAHSLTNPRNDWLTGKANSGALSSAQAEIAEAQALRSMSDNAAAATYQIGLMTAALFAASRAWQSMIGEVTRFHSEVMNIRDLTGASDKQSFTASTQFEAAGLRDTAVMRDILRMTRASFSSQGQSALSMLGIPNNINASGLTLFNSILDKLRSMPTGQRRTKILEDLFGSGGGAGMVGITAMLPLLRMTAEQAKEATNIAGTNYIPHLDEQIQAFTVNLGLMGQAVKRGIWDPIVSFALPPLTALINMVKTGAEWFGQFNNALGGIPATLLGVAAVTLTLAGAIKTLNLALVAMGAVKGLVGLGAATGTLSGVGNAGGILGAITALVPGLFPILSTLGVVAGVGLAGYGIYSAIASRSGGGDSDDKFSNAVDKFTEGVNRLGDNFQAIRGNAFPSGVGERDISVIATSSQTLMAMG